MKKVTEEMYRKYSKNVEFLARSFEKTTHIEADELFAYAWAKITYAIRFHDETKSKEATFISMVARSAMTEVWEEEQKPVREGLVSFESLVTEDEEEHDNSSVFCWDKLSCHDDVFLAELGITISEKSKMTARAIIEHGLKSKAEVFAWAKEQGFRQTEIRFCVFELGLALQGKRVNYV